jgi:sigma-B regulation protein RsbU (phosphoserine phosphatase)
MAGVGGYGVSAAMVTVFAKQTIAKLVSGYATEGRSGSFGLSDLLWSFNREINAQGFELDGLPLHLGIFLGFLDSDWSRLICANAGFTPAGRIVGADGSIQSLALSGHPIGLINQPVFDEMEVSLDPEQRIVLFSDGLIEPADGENQRPVETEIDDFLRGHARTPAEDLAEELLREGVRIRKGHLQQDDISLMILEKAA